MPLKMALGTTLHVTTEYRRAAGLDGGHDLKMGSWERMNLPVRFATCSEDVGEFILRPMLELAPGHPLFLVGRHVGLLDLWWAWRLN